MNYKSIHDKMIEHFKKTTPRERLYIWNKNDFRLKIDDLYVEIHHILPKSLGGGNNKDNLVSLLPEEHFFTNEIIGSVSTSHPMVIDGTWIHITKGRKATDEEKMRALSKFGKNNSNFSGIDDQDYIEVALKYIKKFNFIPGLVRLNRFCNENNIKITRTIPRWRFNGTGKKGFYLELEKLTNLKYNTYYRSEEQKDYLRSKNNNKIWISNDILKKSVCVNNTSNILDTDWFRGRKYGIKN